jgi:hypothetical protein
MTLIRAWPLRSWAGRFLLGSTGGAAALLLAVWAVSGFQRLGLDGPATIALTLGIVLSIGLAVALMALMFYSSRTGRDDAVGGEHYGHPQPPHA